MVELVTIIGPTASGKTHFATHLAKRIDGEIISGDSRQVYRRMDIGTGKDLEEFTVDGVKVPYHLIDIREPGYKFNIHEFQYEFDYALRDVRARGRMPVFVGGSGLYVQSVLEKYTTENTISREKTVLIGIHIDRENRRQRITERLKQRLEEGMIEEVESLLKEGLTHDDLVYYGLEYRWVTSFLRGDIDRKEMESKLETEIHRFAKRQMTWFRKMEREGYEIHWLNWEMNTNEKVAKVLELLG